MIHELKPSDYEVARPLFAQLSKLQVSAGAVLDCQCEGRLVVDDPTHPRTALVTSPEGTYLAGEPGNAETIAALRRFVWDELFGRAEWEIVFITADRPEWEPALADIAAPRDVLHIERRHYECRAPRLDWRALVPDGCSVRRIDAGLLDEPDLDVPDHVRGWIGNNWGTRERFLERGFGFATIRDRRVVSWSLTDCRSAGACEIGIQTRFAHRRQGLATVTAAAAVEHALASGFEVVGWHCNEDNLGSRGTAEKVGFELERQYVSPYLYAEEAEELAEKGWVAFRAGRPEITLALYERVFELRPESPHFQYFLVARASAATGDLDAALEHLGTAIDRGWSDAEITAACTEFEPLHGTPAWEAVMGRLGGRD